MADGPVRRKGMETKKGMDRGNIFMAKGLRTGVQIDQGGKKGERV